MFSGLIRPLWFYYDQLDTIVKAKKKMEANENAEQWVSVEQIAQHLNVKPFTIYMWLERKEMPAHKVGRLWRFRTCEVDLWVKSGKAAMNTGEDDKE